MWIDADKVRRVIAVSDSMTAFTKDLPVLAIAAEPPMRIENWSFQDRAQAMRWASGESSMVPVPVVAWRNRVLRRVQ